MPKINLTDLSNLQNEVTATQAINTNNSIIESAIDNCISRDGTQPNNMNAISRNTIINSRFNNAIVGVNSLCSCYFILKIA